MAVRKLTGPALAREISVAVPRTTAARSTRELLDALTRQAERIREQWGTTDAAGVDPSA
ncbi:hypothetical protein ABZ557_11345 [Streptomyces sp. NPDC019645]|uniref:hypothetical protein n=1 Tax=Streptomyces sp. NPDC019645 TaxID=3154786 RepID=UPI0034028064